MEPHAAEIYALQHRLSSCLKLAEAYVPTPSHGSIGPSSHCTQAASRHIQRLGQLLRKATQLEWQVRHHGQGPAEGREDVVALWREDLNDDEDASDRALQTYYQLQLQTRFTQMCDDMQAAERLLTRYLSQTPGLSLLPVSCVGLAPGLLEMQANASTSRASPWLVYADERPSPEAAHIPATGSFELCPPADSSLEPIKAISPLVREAAHVRAPNAVATVSSTSPSTTPSLSATRATNSAQASVAAASAEDCIMADIERAIHQMKAGALQMSAMMEGEKSKMKSAAELLSVGVAKGEANMRDLDRVSYVVEAMHVPWLFRRVPGLPLVWRSLLQPMWVFVKQAMMMALILAITASILLLISTVSKPTVYRGRRVFPPADPEAARMVLSKPVTVTVETPLQEPSLLPPWTSDAAAVADARKHPFSTDVSEAGVGPFRGPRQPPDDVVDDL